MPVFRGWGYEEPTEDINKEQLLSEVGGEPGECGVTETKREGMFQNTGSDQLCQGLLRAQIREGQRNFYWMWQHRF